MAIRKGKRSKTMKQNMNKEDLIIIDRMYIGPYIKDTENIGHEIINLYQPDNDDHTFVWLNGNGTISKKRVDGKKNILILLVRSFAKDVWEIIGKAHVVKVSEAATKTRAKPLDRENEQKKELTISGTKYGDLTYGGANIYDVMTQNTFHGVKGGHDIFATFECDDLCVPDAPLYITDNKAKNPSIVDLGTKFPRQSLRMFFSKDDTGFDILNDIISGQTWNPCVRKQCANQNCNVRTRNIIERLGDADRELAISNLLAYHLKHCQNEIKDDFFEALKLDKGFKKDTYEVFREQGHVDILLLGKEHIIVIENKIGANIDWDGKDFEGQINSVSSYVEPEKISKELKDELRREREGKNGKCSQLSRYYIYARFLGEMKQVDQNNIAFCILCPNYEESLIKGSLKESLFGDLYEKHLCLYADLKGVFSPLLNKEPFKSSAVENIYLNDFLDVLQRHSQARDHYLEEEMESRFASAI
jgi:hypothetical protein